jgi:subfamily B ATP-binding cassette protein MsbA
VLAIAHCLSTVQKADTIAVLERGELMEMGTHEQLLAKEKGYYRHLYAIQFSDGKPKDVEPDEQVIAKASYEARNYLNSIVNSIVGDLQLLVDDLVDPPEEQLQLTEDAYHSAVSLLKRIFLRIKPTSMKLLSSIQIVHNFFVEPTVAIATLF